MSRRALLLSIALVSACGGRTPPATSPATTPPAAIQPTAAPTAESILEAAIEATGGRGARAGLTAMRATGTMRVPSIGLEGKVEMLVSAPRSMRLRVDLGGLGMQESGTDGAVAWDQSSMTGARVLAGAERERTLRTATFHAELHWRELYAKVELAGEATFADRPAWKLVATTAEGETETLYFDRETRLALGSEATVTSQMGAIATTTVLRDYAAYGPIKMPRTVTQRAQGMEFEISFDQIEWNPTLAADAFALPPAVRALVK